jgi:hypothetical protein
MTENKCEGPKIIDRQAATSRLRCRLSGHGLLIALVLATRIPLIGKFEGQPVSARYVIGLHLWVIGDRNNPLVYARTLSAGYYWLGGQLARITHSSVQSYTLMLIIVSLCATVLLAAAIYELSRYVVGEDSGLVCSLLFFVSPSIWWMGIQPHPQALSAALAVAALCAYLQGMVIARSATWIAISIALLTAGLLVKIDTVLLFPAFIGLLLFRARWDRDTLNRLLVTAAMLAVASVAFLFGRAAILGAGLHQLQAQTTGSVRENLAAQSVLGAVKQAVPIMTALGPVLFLFAIIGVVLATRTFTGEQLARWLLWILAWCLPGWIFWLLIAGNEPRHVALFTLALLWVGITGWVAAYGYKTAATVALVAVLLNFMSIPANSGLLLMSPNVPGSARALHAKEIQMRAMAEAITIQGGTECFVGTYTIPYVRLYLLQASQSGVAVGQEWVSSDRNSITSKSWAKSNLYSITFFEIRPAHKIEMPCSPAYSFEYADDGTQRRFFGNEFDSSPFWTKLRVAAVRRGWNSGS